MQIIEVKNSFLQSSSYIVDNKLLVDCGDVETVFKTMKEKALDSILLTHCHQDHIYGIPKMLEQFPHLSIYCSRATLNGLKDEERNLSYIIPEFSFKFTQEDRVVVIEEGIHIIKGLKVEVFSTPGHSDDCMTYIINDCIFTGDSYIPFSKVFTKWPRSNKMLAIKNEKRIINLINERQLKVYSGHWK